MVIGHSCSDTWEQIAQKVMKLLKYGEVSYPLKPLFSAWLLLQSIIPVLKKHLMVLKVEFKACIMGGTIRILLTRS